MAKAKERGPRPYWDCSVPDAGRWWVLWIGRHPVRLVVGPSLCSRRNTRSRGRWEVHTRSPRVSRGIVAVSFAESHKRKPGRSQFPKDHLPPSLSFPSISRYRYTRFVVR